MNNIDKSAVLSDLIELLPEITELHSPETALHSFLKKVARNEAESLFANKSTVTLEFMPFGNIVFPYINMGSVDSINLFDLDELIIFSFYWRNRKRYNNVLDLGANIGLHSIILEKCGYTVRSYEPDPRHFEILTENISRNNCINIEAVNAGISYKNGEMNFIRVLGNTTGSHIAGSKSNPYGKLEQFPITVESIAPFLEWADFVKMDVEGHEKEIFKNLPADIWKNVDVLLEVQDEESALIIFDNFKEININLFSEKTNWSAVNDLSDMPFSYHDGSLFITPKTYMPWV